MPSKLPRLALTLPEHVRAAVDDVADAMGKPSSKVVTELLEEMVPHLEAIAKVARALKAGDKPAAKRAVSHAYGDAFASLMLEAQADMFQKAKKGTR